MIQQIQQIIENSNSPNILDMTRVLKEASLFADRNVLASELFTYKQLSLIYKLNYIDNLYNRYQIALSNNQEHLPRDTSTERFDAKISRDANIGRAKDIQDYTCLCCGLHNNCRYLLQIF